MTKIQIVKNKRIKLDTLYNKLKKRLLEDHFHVTSDVQTDYVYHLRAEKTGIKIIGSSNFYRFNQFIQFFQIFMP